MNLNEAKQILKNNGYILKESNTVTLSYSNDDLELDVNGKTYRVDVNATADYYSDPGDRWSPPEESFDLNEVNATWYELSGENFENETQVEETKEMSSVLWDYLEKHAEDFGNDNEYDEYDRADYEYDRRRDEELDRARGYID
jgi:hypothetical protein